MGSAEAESWRRYRSSRVEEMAEAVPRLVRAGRPRSRVASSHDVVAAKQIHRSLCFCAFCGHSRQTSRYRILQKARVVNFGV